MESGKEYDELLALLPNAKTTNGRISVGSKVFAVKAGSLETVTVTWPSYYYSCYMWVGDSSVSNAEWSGDNVRIKGVSKGVTELKFSTNEAGTQDYFSAVIICY